MIPAQASIFNEFVRLKSFFNGLDKMGLNVLLCRIVSRVKDHATNEKWSMYDGQELQKYLKAGKGQRYDD